MRDCLPGPGVGVAMRHDILGEGGAICRRGGTIAAYLTDFVHELPPGGVQVPGNHLHATHTPNQGGGDDINLMRSMFKGTVSRDFLYSVFSPKQLLLVSLEMSWGRFDFFCFLAEL